MSRVQADVEPTSAVCGETDSASTERISVVDAIPLKISVVLGSAVMSVREVANLRPGALLTLDRKLGQPVDIIVNDRLVCRGQIAVTEDAPPQFVVRIVELASGSIPDRPRQ